MKKKLNIKKFTLIELIIVIVVIGLLAGMALPKFIGVERDAKVAAMNQDLDVLEKAVQLYESDNDGGYPFVKDGDTYQKVSITRQTLKDSLDAIGDDESQVYTLDMGELKPYLERLKYTDSTTDTYLYSTKTGVAINEQGKTDSGGIVHHILNILSVSGSSINTTNNLKIKLMNNSANTKNSFVMVNDTLYGSGADTCGQLGDGFPNSKTSFRNISLSSGIKFTQVASGSIHSMAIGFDNELYTWGDNSSGQLGDGVVDKNTPTKVILASGIKPKQIACGFAHSMAIGSDGELYTWGQNQFGQLGDGTYENKSTPTKITFPNGVKPTKISSGFSFSIAIGDDGNLYTWGDNFKGQLGDGTSSYAVLTPVKITLPNGVKPTQIACGAGNSMAIGDDGELYTWGNNEGDQLGIGSSDYNAHSTPIKITLASGVKPTQITCGFGHSMVVGTNNKLYIWGENDEGQLGDTTTTNNPNPTVIDPTIEGTTEIIELPSQEE